MATEAIQQVLDTSVDSVGLSIVSGLMSAVAPRQGSMYNPVVLAAGVPMWFHPMQDDRYVALFRSHWINATVGTVGPQSFSAHTEVTSPCWVIVAPPGGQTTVLGTIPTGYSGALVLNAATSRVDNLYTVGTVDGVALVQNHRVTSEGRLVLTNEELMPTVQGVVFDKGCYIDSGALVVFGTDEDGLLYQRRRQWARIGNPATTGLDAWTYRGAKGWLPDPTTLAPIGLASVGPVSTAAFKDRLVLTRVRVDNATEAWSARASDPFNWKRILIGPSLGTPALGGGLYLQPQLSRNQAMALPDGATAGIPYVSSRKLTSGGEASIKNSWGLLPL